jgi:6-phosphogluconolactonase
MAAANPSTTLVFVGAYTRQEAGPRGQAEGISVYRLNPATGALSHLSTTPGIANPSFLALSPDRKYLYAVNEFRQLEGSPGGGVSAFSVDLSSGALTLLNRQLTLGGDPCYVSVDQTGRCVLVANHGGGNVAVFPVNDDGSLEPASQVVQHTGSSVDLRNQSEPHAHWVDVDPGNQFALVCDKGIDRIMVYRFDPLAGQLLANDHPPGRSRPGSGPRHLAFHPSHRVAYVINEIACTITAFAWSGEQGTLQEIQTVPTLPADFSGRNSTADIHVHPNGKFVYGSNRGHDSIVIYAIDEASGQLSYVGHESTQGRTPRNFAIDPTGSLLFAANQNTNTIVSFWIDGTSGRLTPTGQVLETPTPVCQRFVEI